MTVAHASVVSVNVGRAKPMPGKSGVSAIDKRGVDGRVAVTALGLAGDSQSDKANHGGVEQAVYAYATEDLDHWAALLDRELHPGQFGENLSTRGVDVTGHDRRHLADRHDAVTGVAPAPAVRCVPELVGRAALGEAVHRRGSAGRLLAGARGG